MNWVAPLIAVLGALAVAASVRWFWRRRLLAGCAGLSTGLALLIVGLVLSGAALQVYGYQRLTAEREVARLRFDELAPQRYTVLLWSPGSSQAERYELRGDEWQLDARVLKWHGWAQLVGLNSYYRLERLGGRYRDVQRELSAARSVHALSTPRRLDPGQLLQEHAGRLPWVDAIYGSAAYLPMVDGGEFVVHASQTGLVARPANESARRAVGAWGQNLGAALGWN